MPDFDLHPIMADRSTHLTIDDVLTELTTIKQSRGWGGAALTNIAHIQVDSFSGSVWMGDQSVRSQQMKIEDLESDLRETKSELSDANDKVDELEDKLADIKRLSGGGGWKS